MTDGDQLPPGQVWGKRFVIYAALSIPRIDQRNWRLKIDGMVRQPLEYTYDQLTSGPLFHYARSAHCVTSWSMKDVEWDGVQIRKLLEPAGVDPASRWVMFHCSDGYTAPIPIEDALHGDSIIALRLNGRPLSAEQGFPARPFMPQLYLWKSAKWLNRIELIRDYSDGYWEMYGYHGRGNVWEEERFKGHSGKHSRKTAYGTA